MVEISGLTAGGSSVMIKNWWNLALGGILLLAVVLGSIFLLIAAYKKIKKFWRGRQQISAVPAAVVRCLDDLKINTPRLFPERESTKKAKSFGVFTGCFDSPPTPSQISLLSRWDLIVLDPLKAGVLDAASSSRCTSKHIVGRLDVGMAVQSDGGSGNAELIRCLGVVAQILITSFKRPEDTQSPFTGVLLANWQTHFSPVIFNEVIKYMGGLGLAVYLEIAPPVFLTQRECRGINMETIRGIVCRNGTVLPNGKRRNFFQMANMRPALRALAAQSWTNGSVVMMWDTVDDDVELEHAVVKRSFTWCKFSSAISYIGPRAALADAEIAATKVVSEEPLGALMWLKSDDAMRSQEMWWSNDNIVKEPRGDHAVYDSLQSFIPRLTAKLAPLPPCEDVLQAERPATIIDDFHWPSQSHRAHTHPIPFSPSGCDYTGLGCFQLGLDCSLPDFTDLVHTQRQLRELGMLEAVKPEELLRIGDQLRSLPQAQSSWVSTPDESRVVQELLSLLASCNGGENDRLRVYVGLDSGFRTSLTTQFWGLYDVDTISGIMDIYISGKTVDRTGTILHTFMSSRECTRSQCFMAEVALSEQTGSQSEKWEMPHRLVQDIELLSSAETMLLLRRLVLSNPDELPTLSAKLRACCEYQLMEVPSLAQLKALNATAYLRGEISAEELVTSRLTWYRERSCQHPDPSAAIALFTEIDARIPNILVDRQYDFLSQLEVVLQTVLQKNQIDASADLFALSVFCAFRKLALNEVHMEITDRNPLPNGHSDQEACFAELFALGSNCESYFGMTPSVMGEILFDKSQSDYKENQPPQRDDASTELPTAYASGNIDLDPDAGRLELPIYYRITFLGIFAIPAFIDILMLTTIGRGLYLTAYMSSIEKAMGTTALMIALFLTGAIGTWISSGGCYYLHSMAFSAMNMFVLTRFIAGVAVCVASGILALIIIGVTKGFYAGLIFILYYFILSTYLSVLAALAIYQLPGFMFQSGRAIIMTRIPILLISPIVTLFVHHDILVYLCVMTAFLISLLLGARDIISQWSTWYLKVPCVTDTEVVNWYIKTKSSSGSSSGLSEGGVDLAATPLPRKALLDDVLKERNRRSWTKPTSDELVLKLADGYPATMFLLDWYCKYSRTKMPFPYSPTWNLQCKAAIGTLGDIQKGLKFHNAFVHWRHAGDELWAGVLYFVIALLDKWVALLSGGSIVGLSAANSEIYRLAVGFGLAYFLIGAVFLDGLAQPLWQLANKPVPQPITSLKFLQQAAIDDARAKRNLYWKTLIKFFFMHIWGLSITAALMWTFDNSRDATIMYMSYVGAYTALLWYQYNRIFTGPLAFKEALTAVFFGLMTGLILHRLWPRFAYNSVIALGVATWTAALLSLWTSNIMLPSFKDNTKVKTPLIFHSISALGPHPKLTQTALSEIFESICALPEELRFRLDPSTHPGVEVLEILMSRGNQHNSKALQTAFRSAEKLVHGIAELWKTGEVLVDLVPERHLIQQEQKMRAISRTTGGRLHIFIFIGPCLVGDEWILDIHRNCQVIAEAVIQATAESKLGLSHDHSIMAELLAVSGNGEMEGLSVPEGVKRQLENSAIERAKVVKNGDNALLRYLLLGLECDEEWDNLPRTIRSFLLKRCCGEPCHVSDNQASWILSQFCKHDSLDIEEYIARCNVGATLTILISSLAGALEADHSWRDQPEPPYSSYERCIDFVISPSNHGTDRWFVKLFARPIQRVHHALRTCVKFFVVSLVADPEFQRELDYLMSRKPWFIRWPATLALNWIWMFSKGLQQIILPLVLLHGRESVSRLHRNMKGVNTVIEKHKIIIESLSGPSTCFFTPGSEGSSQLHQYSGHHDQDPKGLQHLMSVNTYTDKLVLRRREEYANHSLVNLFTYEYPSGGSKLPLTRRCIEGNLKGQVVHYDERGYITSGSSIKDDNPIEFRFWYRKNAKYDDELIRAEYVLPFISARVSWCVPPANRPEKLDKWIPHSKVMEATFIQGQEVYKSKWNYDHRFHPTISTTLNAQEVVTPPMIQHDYFNVLQKPKNGSFLNDNPLFSFRSVRTSFLSRMLHLNTKWYPISTSRARTHLWKSWKNGKDIDAVTARWLDEIAMRSDRDLKQYWNARDLGRLNAGGDYINSQADTIMARVDLDPEISSWTPLAYRISDLLSFGQGGDATINTRTQSTQLKDSDSELHVLAMDTGTWPNEGGGVSACRRDMVNNLDTIRWHILAESANDFGVPKFQIEKNVQSLTVLPLWGLDFLTPTHGIFQNCLDSAVQEKSHDTRDMDILKNFIPILTTLVQCSRAIRLDRSHVEEASKALVDLNTYFEEGRHWSEVWTSDIVKDEWRKLWLTEDMENARPLSEWLDAERPTLLHLDQALDMWHRYLFIFSVPVPEKIPDVFQASHHFAGASYGVLCKIKRNCTLHVWDHCISWREVTIFLSSAMSFDPPFVCKSLISLSRLASTLILHHADVVLPCADFFNPAWEIEIGTCQGAMGHRRTFQRKIDPVVNGICDMERFKPIETIKTKVPTVVMLSHVRFVKDIKNAILAADIIVNEWGFTDYQLAIYGDMEKAPSYSVECQEIIASKSLRDNVSLKGLGSPFKVLEDAWMFLNSSISEGLPLAMGEAALTGVPVVCTDVGASFRVVTDPITHKRFSAVVAPNDSQSLARAQINVLALLDEWAEYAGDEEGYRPKMSPNPTKEEVKQITARMYAKQEQRRKLGMMGRDNVLSSFSSDRYLREHEQMLWIGKYQSRSYRARIGRHTSSNPISSSSSSRNEKRAVSVNVSLSASS